MALAVELYFDAATERSLTLLRSRLHSSGVVSAPELSGSRPHMSLALVETEDAARLSEFVARFAAATPGCPIRLGAVASFATSQNVLYLAPVPTIALLDLHYRFHTELSDIGLISSPLYRPGNWIPHCTLEMGLRDGELARAFEACRSAFEPLDGRLLSAAVVTYPPPRPLFVTALSGDE